MCSFLLSHRRLVTLSKILQLSFHFPSIEAMLLFIVSDKSLNEVIEIVVKPAHLVLHVLLKLHPPDLNPVYDPSEDS